MDSNKGSPMQEFRQDELHQQRSLVSSTTYPKTKRYRSSKSRQLRRVRRKETICHFRNNMSTSPSVPIRSQSGSRLLGQVNNNDDLVMTNGVNLNQIVQSASFSSGLDHCLCLSTTTVKNLNETDEILQNDEIFGKGNFVSLVPSVEECHSILSMRIADLQLHKDSVYDSLEEWKLTKTSSNLESNHMLPMNTSKDNFLKSILITQSRYSDSTILTTPSSSQKTVQFTPETIFTERNPTSPFWFKIEEERKRRKVLRIVTRESRNILKYVPGNMGKENCVRNLNGFVMTSKLIPLAGNSNNRISSLKTPRHRQSPRKFTKFWSSAAIGIRKTVSNFFSCFSPKIRYEMNSSPIQTPTSISSTRISSTSIISPTDSSSSDIHS